MDLSASPESVSRRSPHKALYRITPTVPEGQYTDEARAGLMQEVTEAVARAEGVDVTDAGPRIWIFPTAIPDGTWGSRGAIRRLPEIMEALGGEAFRKLGEGRLTAKRARDLAAFSKPPLR